MSKINDRNFCCVPQCNSKGSEFPRPSFHLFPEEVEVNACIKNRRKQWINQLRIGKNVSKHMRVCSKHFKDSDFIPSQKTIRHLKKTAIPSENLPILSTQNKENLKLLKEKTKIRHARKVNRECKKLEREEIAIAAKAIVSVNNAGCSHKESVKQSIDLEEEEIAIAAEAIVSMKNSGCYHNNSKKQSLESERDRLVSTAETVLLMNDPGCPHEVGSEDVEPILQSDVNIADVIEGLILLSEERNPAISNDDNMTSNSGASFNTINNQVTSSKDTNDKEVQVKSGDIVPVQTWLENLNGKRLNALTGIATVNLLNALVKLLEADLKEITIKRSHLSVREQLILTMMRIYLNISFAALSALFLIVPSSCKNIFVRTLNYLEKYLSTTVKWLPKEEIVHYMPKCFKKYKNVRVVVDCTEINVERSKCLKCRLSTYSNYKAAHTVKLLAGVSPAGIFTFTSKAYGGRVSDKELMEQCNVVQLLDPYIDAVMVDKGFRIDEVCEENAIKLVRPPFFKSNQQQMSREDCKKTKNIAKARIHVERSLQRMKQFRLLSGKISWEMLPLIDKVLLVCAGITNLSNPILAEDKF